VSRFPIPDTSLPLTPELVERVYQDFIPDEVFEIVNHLLLVHYNGISRSAKLSYQDIGRLLRDKLGYDPGIASHYVLTMKNWIPRAIQIYMERYGWQVLQESQYGDTFYVFSKQTTPTNE
jgi:hypothetical protein